VPTRACARRAARPGEKPDCRGIGTDLLCQGANPAADLVISRQGLPVVPADSWIGNEAGESRVADLVEVFGAAKTRNIQAGIAPAAQLNNIGGRVSPSHNGEALGRGQFPGAELLRKSRDGRSDDGQERGGKADHLYIVAYAVSCRVCAWRTLASPSAGTRHTGRVRHAGAQLSVIFG